MIPLKKLRILTCTSINLVKHASTVIPKDSSISDKFTRDEQNKVLNILNTSNPIELSRLKLSHNRIKCLQNWKMKQGPLKHFSQILEVEGWQVGNVERLCERILANNDVNQKIKRNSLNKRQLVWPILSDGAAKALETVLGIYVDGTGTSWTKINKNDNTITDWDFYSFSELPTKILPTDNFNLAMTILNILPPASAYVFELQSKKNGKSSQTFLQIFELSSMLYALINTRNTSQIDYTNNTEPLNKVYHIRNILSARLFKTLVGGEKVSTIGTVTKLFEQDKTLPCRVITFGTSLVDQYQMVPKDSKELLGQALLLTITFMELIVNKNPESYKAIQPGQR